MRITFLILFSIVVSGLNAQQRILFVGNSLTYYNDLPGLVKKIAKQDGLSLTVNTISKPNYSLEDHWVEGKVEAEIKSTHYDIVIFQQGPSALKASRENLVEYALLFSKICREQKSRMAFYSVWPSGDRQFDFPNVFTSYKAAADTTNGVVCPAGNAWLNVWNEKKDFPLYSADGFHPTEHGSLLAAMVIYASLFHKTNFDFISPEKMSLRFVTNDQLLLLSSAALKAIHQK
jgi:hypothetical protein